MSVSPTPQGLTPPAWSLAVCADPPDDRSLLTSAARLSVDLRLPFLPKPPRSSASDHDAILVVTDRRLEIRPLRGDKALITGPPVCCDLTRIDTSSPEGRSLRQPLARAIGIKRRPTPDRPGPVVIDATAGWGEDAWLLAGLGCRVLCVERHPVAATLLRDALVRAVSQYIDSADAFSRVHTVTADARHLLRRLSRLDPQRTDDLPDPVRPFVAPEVVYLDPMFPGHAQRRTAERKPLRVLRLMVGSDPDAAELLHHALRAARLRVVVKRPLRAEPIEGPRPTGEVRAKSLRYDIYGADALL